MARRNKVGGAEGRRIKKEAEQYNRKRYQDTKDERKRLIIACEDTKSSRFYFQEIFSELQKDFAIAKTSLVIAKHIGTDPNNVLKALLEHPKYETFEHKWIVIDRDEKRLRKGETGGRTVEEFEQALANAEKNKVDVAYSNPCFEIWVLLHFQYYDKKIDRYVLERYLRRYYQYSKSKLFSRMFDPDLQKTAIKNATNLMRWREGQGINPTTDNPSTTVHKLVELLNGFKTANS